MFRGRRDRGELAADQRSAAPLSALWWTAPAGRGLVRGDVATRRLGIGAARGVELRAFLLHWHLQRGAACRVVAKRSFGPGRGGDRNQPGEHIAHGTSDTYFPWTCR